MINYGQLRLKKYNFKNIFIVEDRNFWAQCSNFCDKETDLVLCIDFGLKRQLNDSGYKVEFLDHLIDSGTLEKRNVEMHNFLNTWYKDSKGNDLLEYKGYSLGDSLLLHLINDVSYFCHYFFNILGLKEIKYDSLFVLTKDNTILNSLKKAGLSFHQLEDSIEAPPHPVYLFPILKWVNEKVTPSFSFKVKNVIANLFDTFFIFSDSLKKVKKPTIYIQNYYPTKPIIREIENISSLQVILPNYLGLSKVGKHRRIHYKSNVVSKTIATEMILSYQTNRSCKWNVLSYPIGEYIHEMIDVVLEHYLLDALNKAESIERWMKSVNIKLMIPITNLWTSNRLIMQYCFMNKIPVYMIINGQLNVSFYHDAKDSDYINSYSASIKENYFGNKKNVIPLGDPRMDQYAGVSHKKINRKSPTVIIGAAGYDSIDLNSYLAYEFDFLFDILFCFNESIKKGREANIIIKVRGNGYRDLYTDFVKEYYSHLDIRIVQDKSFFEIISEADFYITIFSQTIFEASCFGIPAIYYKKDTQFIHEPFDGKSELITANDITELQEKIDLFYNGSNVYDSFIEKSIIEKYIGPIDGKNTRRNMDFIMELAQGNHK